MRERSKNRICLCYLFLLSVFAPNLRRKKWILGLRGGEVQAKDMRKAWKKFNVRTSKMGIFREAMNPQVLVENQEGPRLEELIDPTIVAISDKARETGMNLLNNAHNSMIDNYRSIKWLFHELEEVKEKVGHMEENRNGMGSENRKGHGDRLSLAERRINNLKNYNHNLSNQMISLLSSINNNIMSLTGWIKDRGMQEEEDGKDREKARLEDDSAKDNINTGLDQEDQRAQQQEAEENQMAYEAAQVMQKLESKNED